MSGVLRSDVDCGSIRIFSVCEVTEEYLDHYALQSVSIMYVCLQANGLISVVTEGF